MVMVVFTGEVRSQIFTRNI